MPEVLLEPEVILGIAGAALLLAVVFGILLARTSRRLSRLQAHHSAAFPDSADDVVTVLSRHTGDLTEIRQDLATIHNNTEHLRDLLRGTVSRVGIVRYDAFEDMGGQLSFSVALLDERSDGLVISAINGRSETRTYGKPIRGGTSEHNLSREESESIAAAIEQRPPSTLPPASRRRRRAS
jgi:hypothetical protein